MAEENVKSSGVVSLRYCVMSTFNEIGSYNPRQYNRYLQFAIDCFRELNLKVMRRVEVAYLTINDIGVVSLPSDFVDYIAIGINRGGEVITLTKNDKLMLPRNYTDGELVPISYDSSDISSYSLDTTSNVVFTDHFYQGEYVPALYGLGGGFNEGYYRIDYENRLLVIKNDLLRGQEVILEYISTGISLTGSTIVPVQCLPSIKAYIHWKRVANDKKEPLHEKQTKERQYIIETRKLNAVEQSFTKDEYLDVKYKHTKQTLKR